MDYLVHDVRYAQHQLLIVMLLNIQIMEMVLVFVLHVLNPMYCQLIKLDVPILT
jgi:hypothetical protein